MDDPLFVRGAECVGDGDFEDSLDGQATTCS
jgi:hypothetical protein